MSIITQHFAQCDICSYVACDAWKRSKKEVVELMESEGWIKRKGKDICNDCKLAHEESVKGECDV